MWRHLKCSFTLSRRWEGNFESGNTSDGVCKKFVCCLHFLFVEEILQRERSHIGTRVMKEHSQSWFLYTYLIPRNLNCCLREKIVDKNIMRNLIYRYKISEEIVFSGGTKHASNRNGSRGECPRVILSLIVKKYSESTDELMSLNSCLSSKTLDKKLNVMRRLEWIRKFNYLCTIDDNSNKWRKLRTKEEN